MQDKPELIDRDLDLIHSPDDNGWYFQRFPEQDTSQLFPTRADALAYLRGGKPVEWS